MMRATLHIMMSTSSAAFTYATVVALALLGSSQAFTPSSHPLQLLTPSKSSSSVLYSHHNRREFISNAAVIIGGGCSLSVPQSAFAADIDTEDFLKTGMVAMPMGVSGQAGKAKPRTGVVLREGSEPSRDERSGNVLAEILVGKASDPTPVLATFSSPW